MAQEMPNTFFAACKAEGNGTIVARTSAVQSVQRTAAGIYLLTLLEGIGDAECAYGMCPDGLSVTETVRKLSNTQFEVRTFATSTATDGRWNVVIHRINSQNGN
jgi:hypothetical protein